MAGLESMIRPSRSDQQHPGERVGEGGLEARQGGNLVALGLKFGRVRHRRGQHDGQELHHRHVALVERARTIAVNEQQADRLATVQQRDRDDRSDPATARERRIDSAVGLGVEAEQGPAAAHRVSREVVADGQSVRFGHLGRAAGGAEHERVAVEQPHDRGRAADQLARAIRDALHHGLEIEADRREFVLHGDDRAQDGDVDRRLATGGKRVSPGDVLCRHYRSDGCIDARDARKDMSYKSTPAPSPLSTCVR